MIKGMIPAELLALLPREARILVGFSGGPDSLALLALLKERAPQHGWILHAGHVDHGWRPESSQESGILSGIAERLGVPFTSRRTEAAKDEESARKARYATLNGLANELGFTHLALGHTADDQLETLLFRLTRGASLAGLGGIPAKREQTAGPTIVRPMLLCTREKVLAYLRETGLVWLEDPSNLDTAYRRNRLRHQVVPVLKAINPQVATLVARNAEVLQAENRFFEELASQKHREISVDGGIDLAQFSELPLVLRRRVVVYGLSRLLGGHRLFTQAHIERILELSGQGSGRIDIIAGTSASVRYGKLWLYREDQTVIPFIPGSANQLEDWSVESSLLTALVSEEIGRETAIFDAGALPPDLCWRRPRDGDVFWPWGHQHERSLVHFLTRNRIVPWKPWVLASKNIIFWIVGMRRSVRAKITPATRRFLALRASQTPASSV